MMPLATIDWHASFFSLFAALAVGFAIAVVATSNIVRMAFYLTLCLGATAGLFFLAGAQFVGAMQFMIYVGGTLVLLIFGVMLTAQARFIDMKTGAGEWVAGGILGAALLLLLVRAGMSVEKWTTPREDSNQISQADMENTGKIGLGLLGVRADKLDQPNPRLRAGLSGYFLPFVIVSMHLLVVLVGAAYLARTQRVAASARSRRSVLLEPEVVVRKHSFLISAGLVKGMIVNLVFAIAFFTFPQWVGKIAPGEDWSPDMVSFVMALKSVQGWLPVAIGVICGLNVLLLAVVWQWHRWALIGLVVLPIVVGVLVANSAVGMVPAIVLAAILLLPALALLGLIMSGGTNSEWAKME